jgi:hypothetical protein
VNCWSGPRTTSPSASVMRRAAGAAGIGSVWVTSMSSGRVPGS